MTPRETLIGVNEVLFYCQHIQTQLDHVKRLANDLKVKLEEEMVV